MAPGPAYNVITVTGVKDGAAWEVLGRRLLQAVDFAAVPTLPQDHEPVVYMEDTGWPHASLIDFTTFWRDGYFTPMHARPKEGRLLDNNLLHNLITRETPKELKAPGMFMHEALSYRDQWRSRLLRSSRWSPL